MMCRNASTRSVAKKRSATMPTKNGETIAASAVVPDATPTCCPENFRVSPRNVPNVTYHTPQMKNWRNIRADSFTRVTAVILAPIA